MSPSPTISVVMPVYNGEKYLREAIDSIINQTFGDFEFLIINDGSTDKSDEIIRSYNDSRIVYLQNDGNKGLVFTLNYGISKAKGEFIARMDADDISAPTRFENQVKALEANPDIGICGTWAKIIGSANVFKVECENEKIKCLLLFLNQFIHPSVMFRKSILEKNQIRYETNDFPAEDYALWIRLAPFVEMMNIPELLLNYRVHPNQISTASSERQKRKTNDLSVGQLSAFFGYSPNEQEIKDHLFLLNQKDQIKTCDDISRLFLWASRLLEINRKVCYYSDKSFKSCIQEKLESRFIFQNYKNNNPYFLFLFYKAYFGQKIRLRLNFHISLITKCLIFYKWNKKQA